MVNFCASVPKALTLAGYLYANEKYILDKEKAEEVGRFAGVCCKAWVRYPRKLLSGLSLTRLPAPKTPYPFSQIQ